MAFQLSEARLKELAQIEEEANCDIGAGFDWGQTLDHYLATASSCIDAEKLRALLKERLAHVLSQEELEEVARSFQDQLQSRIMKKLQALASD